MAQLLWYLRHEGKTVGPYPPPRVEELLRLGEVSGEWEISLDGRDWLPLGESGHFNVEELAARRESPVHQTAWYAERQRARERWRGEEGNELVAHDARIDEARRQSLSVDQQRTEQLVSAARTQRPSLLIGLLALLALVGIGVSIWLGQGGAPIKASLNQEVDCAAAAGEGVNWSACDKRGAALAGALLRNARLDRTRLEDARLAGAVMEYASAKRANLRNADLRGAKLTAADLSGADLSGADLAGANLRYAVLTGIVLAGTRLDNAVWSDGRTCAPGSIGGCQ